MGWVGEVIRMWVRGVKFITLLPLFTQKTTRPTRHGWVEKNTENLYRLDKGYIDFQGFFPYIPIPYSYYPYNYNTSTPTIPPTTLPTIPTLLTIPPLPTTTTLTSNTICRDGVCGVWPHTSLNPRWVDSGLLDGWVVGSHRANPWVSAQIPTVGRFTILWEGGLGEMRARSRVNPPTNRRLSGFYQEVGKVVEALKATHPLARYHLNGKLGKWERKIEHVTAFLMGVRGSRKKNMFEMGVDYFGRLDNLYRVQMGFRGFPLAHINSARAKSEYRNYLFTRGSLYWDDEREVILRKGGEGEKVGGENGGWKEVDVDEIREKYKKQLGKGMRSGGSRRT